MNPHDSKFPTWDELENELEEVARLFDERNDTDANTL